MKTTAPPIPAKHRATERVSWWGHEYTVTPAVCDAHLGNGRRLIYFQPLNTRPEYYLIRVDSRWSGDAMYDHVEGVIEALADEFGEMERERECLEQDLIEQGIEPTGENTDLAGNEDRLGWPVLSLDSGYSWGTVAVYQGGRWRAPRRS